MREDMWREVAMVLAAAVAVVLLLVLCGCSVSKTSFVDADGSWYENTLRVAPFSKLDGSSASMKYDWLGEGGGSIAVGQRSQGWDNTAQRKALSDALSALSVALAPVSVPASVDGGP